jgi:hypothetical protein
MSGNARSKNKIKRGMDSKKFYSSYLILFPLIAFFIRLITSANTPAGGWAGADGENYLSGVDALLTTGIFAKESVLTYWPAGYPLLIWPFAAISITKFVYMLTFVQSLFFAYSTYYFTNSISKTKLSYLAATTSFFISFNPTLSLGSLAIGYETPVAACLMMACGIAINGIIGDLPKKTSVKQIALIGFWFSLASFLQPRFMLVGAIFVLLCAIYTSGTINRMKMLVVGLIMTLILPTFLIFRNVEAVGKATVSTNLAVTMSLGAGDETLGGYKRIGPAIDCESQSPNSGAGDIGIVTCILKWYVTHPVKTAKLAFHKSLFFWSPWSGPVAEGTMARNPWLKISPVQYLENSVEGPRLVHGNFGNLISYIWLIGQIALLFFGFIKISSRGKFEGRIAILVGVPVAISWIITLGTIGDHRFRVPTMGLSLFLQVAGILAICEKMTKAR